MTPQHQHHVNVCSCLTPVRSEPRSSLRNPHDAIASSEAAGCFSNAHGGGAACGLWALHAAVGACAHGCLTMTTGTLAWWLTYWLTEPMKNSVSGPLPPLPMSTHVEPSSSALVQMMWPMLLLSTSDCRQAKGGGGRG